MSNISQLQDYINQHRTYQEVSDKAFEIDKNWRSESWTRALRDSKKIEAIKKDPNKQSSPNIAYKPLLEEKTLKTPIFKQPEPTQKQSYLIEPRRIRNY